MRPSVFYRVIKWIVSKGLRVYFSQIEIEGEEHIPTDGPFILAANHQNAFLDALIVGSLLPRPLHFLTRSDVFKKWSQPFLKALHMIPIYRIRDGFGQLDKNQEIFDACIGLFAENKGIMIFSEGNHGEHHFLRPLSKGTARMALYAQDHLEKDLIIIPCGLNFFHHRRPRRKLIISYDEPIEVRSFLPTYRENAPQAMRQLKEKLSESMRNCLIIPDETADYHKKKQVLFSPQNESLSFRKMRALATRDHSDVQLISPKRPSSLALAMASLTNFLPLFVLQKVLEKFKDRVFWASMKFTVMLVLMPLWWLMLLLTGWLTLGIWEGIVFIFLSVSGLFIRAELLKTQS